MPLPEPQFDSRTYREILDEALARIPVHNPRWTNFNSSDPGVTLLQLFAFMTESLVYRANLIPERNRQKFLRLLGIPMRAAAAAEGFVTFAQGRGVTSVTTLATDREVLAGRVPFRTANAVDVLPVEGKVFFKQPLAAERRAEVEALYQRLYASFASDPDSAGIPSALDYYETRHFEPPRGGHDLPILDLGEDTLDGVAWLALLAPPRADAALVRGAIAGKVLSLGLLPGADEAGCSVYPASPPAAGASSGLVFELPNTASGEARYERLRITADRDPLQGPARVDLHLPEETKLSYWQDLLPIEAGVGAYPPSLAETDDADRLVTWVRIRPEGEVVTAGPEGAGADGEPVEAAGEAPSRQLTARLSWVGVNTARVVQRAHVAGEPLPSGTGEPDQSVTLANTPVLTESVELSVDGEAWSRVDDLAAAPPEVDTASVGGAGDVSAVAALPLNTGTGACRSVPLSVPTVPGSGSPAGGAADPADPRVFTVDRESGEIRFGDGARGMRPPRGASIVASYDHGGGLAGMVGVGAIDKAPNLASGVKVANPVPTWGGAEAETVEAAEKNIPAVLRHRERLVSVDDTLEIARRTPGVDLGRVEVLPTLHPELPTQTSDGVVTVLVIPLRDPLQPDAPRPDRLFLETVCRYLEPRRVLTTELHVVGPTYRRIWVSVGVDVIPGHDAPAVREAVASALRDFLSPLAGGFEAGGWPLGRAVEALELWATASRVAGVAKVNTLRLGEASGGELERVELAPLELPRLVNAVVEPGDAPTLDEVLGLAADGDEEEGTAVVPVPVVPETC